MDTVRIRRDADGSVRTHSRLIGRYVVSVPSPGTGDGPSKPPTGTDGESDADGEETAAGSALPDVIRPPADGREDVSG